MSTDDENTPQRDFFKQASRHYAVHKSDQVVDEEERGEKQERRRRRKKGNDYCHAFLRAGATRRSRILVFSLAFT